MVRGAVRGYMEIVLVLKKSCDHSEDKGLPFPLRGTDGHLLRDALKGAFRAAATVFGSAPEVAIASTKGSEKESAL